MSTQNPYTPMPYTNNGTVTVAIRMSVNDFKRFFKAAEREEVDLDSYFRMLADYIDSPVTNPLLIPCVFDIIDNLPKLTTSNFEIYMPYLRDRVEFIKNMLIKKVSAEEFSKLKAEEFSELK
jgi:hypothetical protein